MNDKKKILIFDKFEYKIIDKIKQVLPYEPLIQTLKFLYRHNPHYCVFHSNYFYFR